MISVVVFTKNEEFDILGCLQCLKWSNDLIVFDSMSQDGTVGIAEAFGAKIIKRIYDDESTHKNWVLNNVNFKGSSDVSACWGQQCPEQRFKERRTPTASVVHELEEADVQGQLVL